MLTIEFQGNEHLIEYDNKQLIKQIETVINYAYNLHEQLQKQNDELSIIFTTNAEIQTINAQYRDKDVATDVISFAFADYEDDIIFDDAMPHMLGEIFISVEKAEEQALEYEHSFERELIFLALHGFLHLLGYDHIEAEEATAMFALQDKILEALAIYR